MVSFREYVLVDFLPYHLLPTCLSHASEKELSTCTPTALCSFLFILGETITPQSSDDYASTLWPTHNERYKDFYLRFRQRVTPLIEQISRLLCEPRRLSLRSDICAGGRLDKRWKELFQIEFQKEF